MQTLVLSRPASVPENLAQFKIERVARSDPHTAVLKQGSRRVCLRFNETVWIDDLRSYCRGQLGWKGLEELTVHVDGRRYSAEEAQSLALVPETGTVDFGGLVTCQPSKLEFSRAAPEKG